jgi:prevent-host-death family protein
MSVMPLGDVRDHLSEIVNEVETTHERVTVTRHGRPAVVIIAVADLESILESVDIIRTPGALQEIQESEAALSRGEGIGADELGEIIARRQAAG